MLYMVGPLIFIPLWAYHMCDWWLLFGVIVSYVGSSSAGQYSSGIFLFWCYCIGFWIHNGFNIHHHTTFYFLCAGTAYMTWHLADTIRMDCARRSLIDSSELYYSAVRQNKIMTFQLDSFNNLVWTAADISAVMDRSLLQLKPHVMLLVLSNIVIKAFTY